MIKGNKYHIWNGNCETIETQWMNNSELIHITEQYFTFLSEDGNIISINRDNIIPWDHKLKNKRGFFMCIPTLPNSQTLLIKI